MGERATTNRNKKDCASPREIREEIAEEIRSTGAQPLLRQPNRDRARGERSRTGVQQDLATSRSALDLKNSIDERS
jgi:hypothetical protein